MSEDTSRKLNPVPPWTEDEIDDASDDSFPASDPPSFNPVVGPGQTLPPSGDSSPQARRWLPTNGRSTAVLGASLAAVLAILFALGLSRRHR